ncbi:Open rectifier potassium channel protein 1, partial [Gryllus bimaculatus]
MSPVPRRAADEDLEELLQEAVRASNRGVSAARNASGEPNWSFGQALFFSSTVVTTIGYGHVTPLSRAGKLFCMAYAVLGIPLTLSLNARLGHLYPPFNIRLLHLGLVGGALVVCFVLLPAAAFAALEPDWDFLDAVYYCFISLTTIGLGDYIPGDSPDQPYRPVYKVATTVYLLAGLTFMMLTLTVFYDIPQLNLGLLFVLRADETTGDPEKARLQTPGAMGPKYTQQLDAPAHAPPLHALGAGAGAGAAAGAGRRAPGPSVRVKSRRATKTPPSPRTPRPPRAALETPAPRPHAPPPPPPRPRTATPRSSAAAVSGEKPPRLPGDAVALHNQKSYLNANSFQTMNLLLHFKMKNTFKFYNSNKPHDSFLAIKLVQNYKNYKERLQCNEFKPQYVKIKQ